MAYSPMKKHSVEGLFQHPLAFTLIDQLITSQPRLKTSAIAARQPCSSHDHPNFRALT